MANLLPDIGVVNSLGDARGGEVVRADERGLSHSQINKKWQRLDSNQRLGAYEFQILVQLCIMLYL